MDYDEENVLTEYVWDHYQSLMTDLERRIGGAVWAELRTVKSSSPRNTDPNEHTQHLPSDPAIRAALVEGPHVFLRRVRDRLLLQYPGKIAINRCPRCTRVLRSPDARQCFWCGYDWHGAAEG